MAYDITYPIDFRSGGDSVKAAFSKLIEEVRTIYGILNELAGDDFTDEQRASILASLTGNIDGSRITGNIDAVHISGTLTASKVSGALTNATIASGNVTGLEAFVKGLISGSGDDDGDDSGGNGDGITEKSFDETGYVKFANGLIVQWGKVTLTLSDPTTKDYRYKVSQLATQFSSSSYCTACSSGGAYSAYAYPAGSADIRCGVSDENGTVFYIAIGV